MPDRGRCFGMPVELIMTRFRIAPDAPDGSLPHSLPTIPRAHICVSEDFPSRPPPSLPSMILFAENHRPPSLLIATIAVQPEDAMTPASLPPCLSPCLDPSALPGTSMTDRYQRKIGPRI